MEAITARCTVERVEYLPGMHCLLLTADTVDALGGLKGQRMLCSVRGMAPFHCGMMAAGEGRGYIMLSKARMKAFGLRLYDGAEVTLTPDPTPYGAEMPEELTELLAQDAEGDRRFQLLTPGKQRYIIQYVSSVKSIDKRIGRAMLLIGNLKRLPEGKEEFRHMLGKE